MIVYTHLGMHPEDSEIFQIATQKAFRNLEDEYRSGEILVTRTSRLLEYCLQQKYLNWSYHQGAAGIRIIIKNVQDPVFGPFVPSINQLFGLTFYVPENVDVQIFLENQKIDQVQHNLPDHTGRPSVTIQSDILMN